MDDDPIPSHIKRFILTSIDSVPHLEAVLLLRRDAKTEWSAKMMAQTLYISENRINELLADLCKAGFAAVKDNDGSLYYYSPASPSLRETMDELCAIYEKNLIEVTSLIHSKTSKQAQKFGDAFKWKDEKDR